MTTYKAHLLAIFGTILLANGLAARAYAVTATCGADALANTTGVLCAPGTGTCSAALVSVTTAIEVTSGGCEFDLGGRAVSFDAPFEMTGFGFIRVINAGDITLTSTGALKARGDFVQPFGEIVRGGMISLISAGTIDISGVIDVAGDSAGSVRLVAAQDIRLQSGAAVEGPGKSTFVEVGDRFTDGGEFEATAQAGSITIDGTINFTGQSAGTGGTIDFIAGQNFVLTRSIDVSSGAGDGGEFNATVGDHISIEGSIKANSDGNGGFGGVVALDAGEDFLGGVVAGGTIDIDGAELQMTGSFTDKEMAETGGDGGELELLAAGNIRIFGVGVAIRASAGTGQDGTGGTITIDSGDSNPSVLGPLDGDIEIDGQISMRSGGIAGDGGSIELSAGRDLVFTASLDSSGVDSGGDVTGTAGRSITLDGPITTQGREAASQGGLVDFEAGLASDEGASGNIVVQKNIVAPSGAQHGSGQSISLAGCGLTISPSVKIDGAGGVNPINNALGGSDIELIARRPMLLGGNSKYFAAPGGKVIAAHPPGANPVIGSNVSFDPPLLDQATLARPYPNCPVCGDGVRQFGEMCDKGAAADGACCNATCNAFTCLTATPTPTLSPTRTPTPSRTPTSTRTRTATPTVVGTGSTPTSAPPTSTVAATPAITATALPAVTATALPASPTATSTPTPTRTATLTVTPTAAATVASTPTATPTAAATVASTPTATPTAAATVASTPTATPTAAATVASTPPATPTAAATVASTSPATPTATATVASTPPVTVTPVPTLTTPTMTPTVTVTSEPVLTATPLPTTTLLATAAVTPVATTTPFGDATATLVPTPAPTSTSDAVAINGLADAVAAKTATKCQQAIGKAGVSFLTARLKQLDACVTGILKCVQTKPDEACFSKASAKCVTVRGAAGTAHAKLLAAVQSKCGTTLVTTADLRGATGLGYENLDTECMPELGDMPANVADVAECIARRYSCRASQLYATQAPRASELLRLTGVAPDADGCLPVYDGDGKGVGDVVQGKAIQQCAAAITKTASGFIAKKLSSLTKCVDKIFACIQTKPDDKACLTKANVACGKERVKIAAERAKVGPAIDKKCGGIDFNVNVRPPHAVNLAALLTTFPGADTLDTLTNYEAELRLQHDCAAEELLRVIAPRAEGLIRALAPSLSIPSAGCAAP